MGEKPIIVFMHFFQNGMTRTKEMLLFGFAFKFEKMGNGISFGGRLLRTQGKAIKSPRGLHAIAIVGGKNNFLKPLKSQLRETHLPINL